MLPSSPSAAPVSRLSGPGLSTYLREHAAFCDGSGAPLYGVLLRGMADDYDSGGVAHRLLGGWEGRPRGAVVQLRLLGGLHRLVLQRRAPLLATYYRSVGGEADPDTAWPVARDVVEDHLDELAEALSAVPQTNEVGRAAALAVGLTQAARRRGLSRVRLLELGSSAGLNLLVDRFRITTGTGDWQWGPSGSPVDLNGTVDGRLLPVDGGVRIVSRRGCDLAPVDPLSPEGRLRLTSFVWPDHVERHRRLAGALAVAAAAGPGAAPVDPAEALPWLEQQLADDADHGVLTVVWHSVFWQYLDDLTRAAILATIERARARTALVHLRLESPSAPHDTAPELCLDDMLLGQAHAHGVPVRLLPR
jgi:hypothetical protein